MLQHKKDNFMLCDMLYILCMQNYWLVKYLMIGSKILLGDFKLAVLSTEEKETHACSINGAYLIWCSL